LFLQGPAAPARLAKAAFALSSVARQIADSGNRQSRLEMVRLTEHDITVRSTVLVF
jgi:hypothetical protein